MSSDWLWQRRWISSAVIRKQMRIMYYFWNTYGSDDRSSVGWSRNHGGEPNRTGTELLNVSRVNTPRGLVTSTWNLYTCSHVFYKSWCVESIWSPIYNRQAVTKPIVTSLASCWCSAYSWSTRGQRTAMESTHVNKGHGTYRCTLYIYTLTDSAFNILTLA